MSYGLVDRAAFFNLRRTYRHLHIFVDGIDITSQFVLVSDSESKAVILTKVDDKFVLDENGEAKMEVVYGKVEFLEVQRKSPFTSGLL